jgi:hypothetical protein
MSRAPTIAAVNALSYAREIKELFLAHERPEFPDFFDRAYPPAFADGATSWLGRDPEGRLAMHIACLPHRFRFRGREVVAGLLANLMVTKAYRAFFPALALVNRLVRDSKARGHIDFLYADPNEESRALLRGTRFVRVGTLRRYVLPVGDRRPAVNLGIRLFHTLVRATSGGLRRAKVVPHPAARFEADAFSAPPGDSPRLTAYHNRTLYVGRLQGYPGDRDWWLTCHRDGGAGPADAALLVRGPDASGCAGLHAVRWATHPHLPLPSVLPGLVAELRRHGCERLDLMAVAESDLGRALRRCGFIPRSDAVPLFALALTPLGEECMRSVKHWDITHLDCDR